MNKKDKIYLALSIILLTSMAVFAFTNGSEQSFWADELASIGYIRSGISLKEMFVNYLRVDTNLPLYSLIMYFVYRLMPYGEKYLLIPSILFCVLGIIVCALAVRRLRGRDAGFLMICLGTASSTLLWQGAWEIRCYALVFLLSACSLLAYIEKSINNNKKTITLYGISLFFLLWSHWFGCILVALYGLTDIFLIVSRKYHWKNILPYLLNGVLMLPWLIMVLINQQESLSGFWVPVPGFKNTVWTILFLLSGNRVLWYICLITAMILSIGFLYRFLLKKDKSNIIKNLYALIVFSIGGVIGIVFIYSYFINPRASLYVERYFTIIMPHIFAVTVYGLLAIIDAAAYIGKIIESRYKIKAARFVKGGTAACIALLIVISLGICYRNSYITARKSQEDYRGAAQFLVEEGGLWEENALLVGKNRACMLDGFVDYYFVKRGIEEPPHIIDSAVNLPEETRFYPNYKEFGIENILNYDKLYNLRIHMDRDDELTAFIEAHYDKVENNEEIGIEIWKKK